MKTIRVLINGCNGKMGQEVAKKARIMEGIEVLAGVDRQDSGDNFFPVYTDLSKIKEIPDVIIDFSVPEASMKILDFAIEKKIPIVVATTGFSEEELVKVHDAGKTIPVFQSYNMSYSVSVMKKIAAELAKLLDGTDIEIVETHHRRKIDSPSGTALMLAESINDALENKMHYEYNRHSKREKRSPDEIGIHSIRGGTEAGTHTVIYFGEDESMELKHTVTSRAVFAEGAIKAAKYLVNQDNGVYNMNNMV
ncbi:MAG: 4-hydroxy-tetrahydrodipicolinate reductase [Clostridia bacterium]|nr:4-hydroxy-tetrahydrodipicolinate reductase [Clostridia bacterium]